MIRNHLRFMRTMPGILVVGALVNLCVVFTYVHFMNTTYGGVITSPRLFSQDTPSYLTATQFVVDSFHGDATVTPEGIILTRLLTSPLLLIWMASVGSLIGSFSSAMLLLNVGLYLFSVLIFYNILMLLYKSVRVAWIGSVLFMTNWCLWSYGMTYLSDMGGWFFLLLATYCGLRWYTESYTPKFLYYGIIAAFLGSFMKEYGALGYMTLGFLVLFATLPWSEKLKRLLYISIGGICLVGYHVWFYLHFGYSYFGWWGSNVESYASTEAGLGITNIVNFIKVIALIFFVGWPFFLLGLYYEWRAYMQGDRSRYLLQGATLPAALSFLVWPAIFWRTSFVLIPWVVSVAAYGLAHIRSNTVVAACVVVYILFNYHVDVLMMHINL